MNLPSRLGWALLAAFFSAAPAVRAQDSYPRQPITLVIPYAAGGPTDTFARVLASAWGKQMNATMVVENRTGAGTIVGTDTVARARPDGYTLLMTTVAHAVNPAINKKLPYDTIRSFTPIGLAARSPLVLLVNPSFPARNMREFIDYLKAHPGEVSYGSAGVGSASHIGAALLNHEANLQSTHIPYRGNGPVSADLMGGHIGYTFDSAPTGIAQAKSGAVRLLGTSMKERLPQTPDTPAIAETVAGYEAYTWNAVFAPAGTAAPIVEKLARSLRDALDDKELKAKAYEMGLLLEKNPSPAALTEFLDGEILKWGRVAKAAQIAAD